MAVLSGYGISASSECLLSNTFGKLKCKDLFCSILTNSNHKSPTPSNKIGRMCLCSGVARKTNTSLQEQIQPLFLFGLYYFWGRKTYFFISCLDVYIYFMIILIFPIPCVNNKEILKACTSSCSVGDPSKFSFTKLF